MEAAGSSRLLISVCQATRCHIPEYHNPTIHCHGNSKSQADLYKPIAMEVCYWALLFMPLVILHHLLNVFVQLANKKGIKKKSVAGYGSKNYTERRHGAGDPVCSKLWLGVLVLTPCGLD
jgi:hypothetical protein